MQIYSCQNEGCPETVFYSEGFRGYDPTTPKERGWVKIDNHKYMCPVHGKPEAKVQEVLDFK